GIRDRTVTGVQTCALPIYFYPVTFLLPRPFIFVSATCGVPVEGPDERRRRAASDRGGQARSCALWGALSALRVSGVCVCFAARRHAGRGGRHYFGCFSPRAGELKKVRVAWSSVCCMADSHRGTSHDRSLAEK